MAQDTLSDKAIKSNLKEAVATGKAITLNDGGGLRLIARPDGSGWWRFRYWLDKKEGLLSLGIYPDVTLAMARQRREEARRQIASGIDPSAQRKATKAQAAAQAVAERMAADGKPMPGTFEFVAREWLERVHQEKVSAGHAERTLTRFENDLFPFLGTRQLADIEPPELLAVLRKIEERGAIETAHRTKDSAAQVFRYGIAIGACTRNPASDLKDALKPVLTKHYAAITDPSQVGALLRDIAAYQGHPVTLAALKLSALLLLRPGELRHMEWAWLDLEAGMLTVPPEVMKRRKDGKINGAPHLVPLAPQAVQILQELQPLTGTGRFVFPALTSTVRCMSDNTVRSALRRMGYSNDDMTAHGFRAMARTMADERLGIAPEVIEAQLAHDVADSLGRAYNRTQYIDQRRSLMTQWAEYLDRLRDGAQVIPIRAA